MPNFGAGFARSFSRSFPSSVRTFLQEKRYDEYREDRQDQQFWKQHEVERKERKKWIEEQSALRQKRKTKAKDKGIITKLLSGDPYSPEVQEQISELSDPGVRRYSAIQRATPQRPKAPKVVITGTEERVNEQDYVDKWTFMSDGTVRVDKTLKASPRKKEEETRNRDLKKEFGKYRKYAFELDQLKAGTQAIAQKIIQTPFSEKSPHYKKKGVWGLDVKDKPLKSGEIETEFTGFYPELPAAIQGAYAKYTATSNFYQQEIYNNLFTNELKAITESMEARPSAAKKIAQEIYRKSESGEIELTENELIALSIWYKYKFGDYLNWQEMTNNQE